MKGRFKRNKYKWGKIEIVEEASYLGQIIALEKRTQKEINVRIAKTWTKYWTLKKIFKGPFTSPKVKSFKICVLPTLIYGCRTWKMNEALIKKIKVAQNALERSISGMKMKDRIRLTTIKQKLRKNIDAARQIRRKKWG